MHVGKKPVSGPRVSEPCSNILIPCDIESQPVCGVTKSQHVFLMLSRCFSSGLMFFKTLSTPLGHVPGASGHNSLRGVMSCVCHVKGSSYVAAVLIGPHSHVLCILCILC